MRRALAAPLAVLLAIAAAGGTHAFEIGLDAGAIARAVALGRSRDQAKLRQYHSAYLFSLDPPFDRLEILTEYRRIVIAAEERSGFDSAWGAEQAAAMLRPLRGTVALVLHVTFPPNNVYRAMPAFDIVLYDRAGSAAGRRIAPREVRATPRYLPGQPAPAGTPILGGSIEAIFDARTLQRRAVYLAGIFREGRELRRVDVDFGRIE